MKRVAFALLGLIALTSRADAATITWKGRQWLVTSGAMAGVCQGDPANVVVDADGNLHFHISNSGGKWTAAEIFTPDNLGLGTYQWVVDGPIDTYDENVVLGLFPYGPQNDIGTDGTNEIDIEYSRWGQAAGPNGDWTDYPAYGTTVGEKTYTFSLGGMTTSTSRFVWARDHITSSLFAGAQPIDSTAELVETWTYAPTDPTMNIPQRALPLGMNLWCFDAPPSDGQPVEIVIRDFQFVPEGTPSTPDAGATDAADDSAPGPVDAAVDATAADGGTTDASTSSTPKASGCAVAGDAGGASAATFGVAALLSARARASRRRRGSKRGRSAARARR
ncbi:MAG TPA: glycoside hydrolase family 16 protein [Polyangia bacterium]|nr:glycoside hydrolase family 16 protein [Polyangia bacterium]